MKTILGIFLLILDILLRTLPLALSVMLSTNISISGGINRLKRFRIIYIAGYAILTPCLYFLIHLRLTGRRNFINTIKQIVNMDFAYQDINYLSKSLLVFTAAAFMFAFLFRWFVKAVDAIAFLFKAKSDDPPSQTALWSGLQPFKNLIYGIFSLLLLSVIGLTGIEEWCNHSLMINEVTVNAPYDYVELYNAGFLPHKLYRLYLSDDLQKPQKKEIPFVVILPGQHFIVRVSKNDKSTFSVKRTSPQTLWLCSASGHVIDTVTKPQLTYGISYARESDGAAAWTIQKPTRGQANTNLSPDVAGIEPVFSADSGFYRKAFDLTLTSPDGYDIYYTTDCSNPTVSSARYTQPIHVYDPSDEDNRVRSIQNVVMDWKNYTPDTQKVDKAFVVLAIAVTPDGATSRIVTKTYFIHKKYEGTAVVSIVSDPDGLFGDNGIYVTGKAYDDWYSGNQNGGNPGANFFGRGIDFEVPASFHYLSDQLSFSQDTGLRVSGGSSRNSGLKSFTLYARNEYSGNNYFEQDIFKGIRSDKLGTRGGYANSIIQSLAHDRNVATQQMKRISLFLNGEFMCHTNLLEKYDKQYFSERYHVFADNVIVVNQGQVTEGTNSDITYRNEIYQFLMSNDISSEEVYAQFGKIVDLQSYIDYMCIRTYVDDMDFTEDKNTILWRTRTKTEKSYEDGRWRWALYDLDAMEWNDAALWNCSSQAEKNSFRLTPRYTGNLAIGNQGIFAKLKNNPAFKKQYTLTFMDLVNTTFQYNKVKSAIYQYGTDLTDYQPGNGGTQEISYYLDFFRNRAKYIVPYMAEEMGLKGMLQPLTVTVNDPEGGTVTVNTCQPDLSGGTWTGRYFTDYPVTVTAAPHPGYVFRGWTGDSDAADETIEINLSGGAALHAVFEKK